MGFASLYPSYEFAIKHAWPPNNSLAAPGLDEAGGAFGPCNSTQSKANEDTNEHNGRPIAVNASPYATQKRGSDQHSSESENDSTKREAHQSREQGDQ